jgi:hypothetical protein
MGYGRVIEASEAVFAAFESKGSWAARVERAGGALRTLLDALDGAAWEASRDPDVQRRFVRLAQGVRGALVGLEAESREGGDEAGQVELLEALGEGLERRAAPLQPADPLAAFDR